MSNYDVFRAKVFAALEALRAELKDKVAQLSEGGSGKLNSLKLKSEAIGITLVIEEIDTQIEELKSL